MTARRIDQGMAVIAAEMLPETVTKEHRTRYRQLPMMVHRAGLAATYAFAASKEREPRYGTAYRDVTKGIRERLGARRLVDLDDDASHSDVLSALGGLEAADYARATHEIAALLGWLNRLADAAYEPDRTDNRTEDGTDDSADDPEAVTDEPAHGDAP